MSQTMLGNRLNRLSALHIDWSLFALLLLTLSIGLAILLSASKGNDIQMYRQLSHVGIGLCIMIGIAQIPPRLLKLLAPILYTSGLILLSVVMLIGFTSKGAQRWLDLGFFKVQPAEIMKLGVPMMLAYYLQNKILPLKGIDFSVCLLLISVPAGMIIFQPDLGTGLLIALSGVMVLFFAGIRWQWCLSFFGIGLVSMPVLWMGLKSYQKQRVLTFLNPESDPLGSGYHIIQSKIAIGSGGLYGKGWFSGSQSQLSFLPEQSTDFIFSVLAEEFGFLGIVVLFAVYLLIIVRGLYIGIQAQDTFSRLLAGSLTLTFFIYMFVNVGMVSGLLPVVGLPLPLISYGGSSLVTLLAGFGILMSIQTHQKYLPR